MYTNTHQVAGLSRVITASRQRVLPAADIAGSDHIVPTLPAVLKETMATIIVENAFVKVNTALPDHPGSCGAMKSLLQSAALVAWSRPRSGNVGPGLHRGVHAMRCICGSPER